MSGKLFLGGISPNTNTNGIKEHFEQFGTVIDAVVMVKDGRPRGFGFVTFDDPTSAQEALMVEQVIDGRTVDVKDAVPQGLAPQPIPQPGREMGPCVRPAGRTMVGPGYGRNDSRGGGPSAGGPGAGPATDKVFVGGMTQTTTDDQLRDYFAQYGTLVDVVVMKDRATQRSRGFGFVQYDDTEPVESIMAEYASHQLDGKWVEVKRAVSKEHMAPPAARGSPYGGGKGGCQGARGQGAFGRPPQFYAGPPSHPYGGHGMQYGYGHQPPGMQHVYGHPPPGHNPYGGCGPYGAPGGALPGLGPPPGAYGGGCGGKGGASRVRPY